MRLQKKFLGCFVVSACIAGATVVAQETDTLSSTQLGEVVDPEETLEPEVVIIQRGEQRIEEYRIGGQLYMVKIVPSKGLPYYLLDNDGDGRLETRRNDLDPDIVVPRWTLFRF